MKYLWLILLTSCATDNTRLQASINKLVMRVNLLEQKVGEMDADIGILKTTPKDGK